MNGLFTGVCIYNTINGGCSSAMFDFHRVVAGVSCSCLNRKQPLGRLGENGDEKAWQMVGQWWMMTQFLTFLNRLNGG